MRVISNRMLVEFGSRHPLAHEPLQVWRKLMESRVFVSFADLKQTFRSMDKVGDYYVFNIGGNKYRLIAQLNFERNKLFIRDVMTHKDYNLWKP